MGEGGCKIFFLSVPPYFFKYNSPYIIIILEGQAPTIIEDKHRGNFADYPPELLPAPLPAKLRNMSWKPPPPPPPLLLLVDGDWNDEDELYELYP